MSRLSAVLCAYAFAMTLTQAQTKPNFTGTWIVVTPSAAAGQEAQVRHTETMLSTGHASEGGGHQASYKLDGTESRNELTSHGGKIVTISKAAWEGAKVVITSATTYPDGRTMESKETWSLDPAGHLVVETTQLMTGQSLRTMTVIHRKK